MDAASSVFMIRPASFGFNPETSGTNAFQINPNTKEANISAEARKEFDRMVTCLQSENLDVTVFEDVPFPPKPDAVFPNNWISMHPDGTVVIYPMMAPNRRWEFRSDVLDLLKARYDLKKIIDLRFFEEENKFLEGTGSISFSHSNKKMFVSVSPRSHPEPAIYLSEVLGYDLILFNTLGPDKNPVYHTNVILNFCHDWAVICLEALPNRDERNHVEEIIRSCGYKILEIDFQQMISFGGNILSLNNKKGDSILVISEQAYKHFTTQQKSMIENNFKRIITVPVPIIEKYGGGSVRCMMAENFISMKKV